MRSSTLVALVTVTLMLLLASSHCAEWADKYPLCMHPFVNPVSMTSSPAQIEIEKFMGKWFEIARFASHYHETGCVCFDKTYSLNPEGYINVEEVCKKEDSTTRISTPRAFSRNSENSKIEVYYNPRFKMNFWILDIGEQYEWVAVGEPCMKMGWILARNENPSKRAIEDAVNLFGKKGYDVSSITYRPAACNI